MTTEQLIGHLKNIAVIIGVITPLYTAGAWFVNNIKKDILNEFREEAATLRTEFLHDVEERYDDISFEIHKLRESNQVIPEYLLSKQKRLERRMSLLREAK